MNALVQWGGYHWGAGPGIMGYGYGMPWFGGIFMILFWVAMIVGFIFLIRWLVVASRSGGQGVSHGDDTALDILRKRYARGEIDKQEFEGRRRDLIA
jgi:putative membrane protein